MSTTTVLAISASAWGVAMAVSPLLQVRAIVTRGTSRGVSVTYQAVLFVGFTLWLAYAITIENAALIVPNSIALIVSAATIAVTRRYRVGRLVGGQRGNVGECGAAALRVRRRRAAE